MDRLPEILRKQQLLNDAVHGTKGIVLRLHDARASTLEGVLGRGDRRVGAAIQRAFEAGARFDSWDDQLRIELWDQTFQELGIEPRRYLDAWPTTAQTPWDHVDVGIQRRFLQREYRRALLGRVSPPCGQPIAPATAATEAEPSRRRLICYHCGATCDLEAMRSRRLETMADIHSQIVEGDPSATRAVDVPVPERDRPAQPGVMAARWRLRYAKLGPAALLGHLDLVRELPRVLRRAGLRAAYTRGFHPKPDMSYGPALALGVASLDERLDVTLIDAPLADELVSRLNRSSVSGLEFSEAALLAPRAAGLQVEIGEALYLVALDHAAVEACGGPGWLRRQVEALLSAEACPLLRSGKRGRATVDARAWITEVRLDSSEVGPTLERSGVTGEAVGVWVRVLIGPAGTLRPGEIVAAVTGQAGIAYRAVRVALLARGGAPVPLVPLAGSLPGA
jgi:radical SAM-linked protein